MQLHVGNYKKKKFHTRLKFVAPRFHFVVSRQRTVFAYESQCASPPGHKTVQCEGGKKERKTKERVKDTQKRHVAWVSPVSTVCFSLSLLDWVAAQRKPSTKIASPPERAAPKEGKVWEPCPFLPFFFLCLGTILVFGRGAVLRTKKIKNKNLDFLHVSIFHS